MTFLVKCIFCKGIALNFVNVYGLAPKAYINELDLIKGFGLASPRFQF